MISPGIDEQDYETDYPNYLRGFSSLLIQGFLILFVYVLAPLNAYAASGATAEICGNGYDDASSGYTYGSCPAGWRNAFMEGVGCDQLCPAPDQDNDGYSSTGAGGYFSGIDCDDTNEFDYPGKTISTDGGTTYKTCQSNGTYTAPVTSATTPFTDTGCIRNYYIDPSGGSNANAGTYASPWQTLEMVCDDTGARPGGAITLTAGDCIYMKGAGTYTTKYLYSGAAEIFLCRLNNKDGTAANPIRFENYPGATVLMDPSCAAGSECGGFYIGSSDYVYIDGLRITNTDGACSFCGNSAVYYNTSSYGKVERAMIYNNSGDHNNNMAGLKMEGGGDQLQVFNSYIFNNYDKDRAAASNSPNNTNITYFLGTNHKVDFNRLYFTQVYTNTAANMRGTPLIMKHSSVGTTLDIIGNTFWNCSAENFGNGCINVSSKNVTIARNKAIDGERFVNYANLGGPCYFGDMTVKYNSARKMQALRYIPDSTYAAITGNAPMVYGNIFEDTRATYNSDHAMINMSPYGGAGAFTTHTVDAKGDFYNNCYYNSANAALTNGFNIASGSGIQTNFAGWITQNYGVGGLFDRGSFNANPNWTAGTWVPGNANCATFGWLNGNPSSTSPQCLQLLRVGK